MPDQASKPSVENPRSEARQKKGIRARLPKYLGPKHRLFRDHDERLRSAPDPERARRMFGRRLREMRRVQRIKAACFAGIYFSAIVAVASFATRRVMELAGISRLVDFVAGFASSLTLLFVIGVLLSNRVLAYLEVDLHFFSAESRMATNRR